MIVLFTSVLRQRNAQHLAALKRRLKYADKTSKPRLCQGALYTSQECVVFDSKKRVLEVRTNLFSASRNYINGVTPDVLIALPGGAGTASEVAVAVSQGRPVIYLKSRQLLTRLTTHALASRLSRINDGEKNYIDVETVSNLGLPGFDCNDVNAAETKLREICTDTNMRADITFYPENFGGAPCKSQFEVAFSRYSDRM